MDSTGAVSALLPLLDKLNNALTDRGLLWFILPRSTTILGRDAAGKELFRVPAPFPNFEIVLNTCLESLAVMVERRDFECLVTEADQMTHALEDYAAWVAYQRSVTLDSDPLEAALTLAEEYRAMYPQATLCDHETQSLHVYRKC